MHKHIHHNGMINSNNATTILISVVAFFLSFHISWGGYPVDEGLIRIDGDGAVKRILQMQDGTIEEELIVKLDLEGVQLVYSGNPPYVNYFNRDAEIMVFTLGMQYFETWVAYGPKFSHVKKLAGNAHERYLQEMEPIVDIERRLIAVGYNHWPGESVEPEKWIKVFGGEDFQEISVIDGYNGRSGAFSRNGKILYFYSSKGLFYYDWRGGNEIDEIFCIRDLNYDWCFIHDLEGDEIVMSTYGPTRDEKVLNVINISDPSDWKILARVKQVEKSIGHAEYFPSDDKIVFFENQEEIGGYQAPRTGRVGIYDTILKKRVGSFQFDPIEVKKFRNLRFEDGDYVADLYYDKEFRISAEKMRSNLDVDMQKEQAVNSADEKISIEPKTKPFEEKERYSPPVPEEVQRDIYPWVIAAVILALLALGVEVFRMKRKKS